MTYVIWALLAVLSAGGLGVTRWLFTTSTWQGVVVPDTLPVVEYAVSPAHDPIGLT